MKMNILYQFNEKYATYAGVSITSLLENNKKMKEIRIYILGEELLEDSIKKLQEVTNRYEVEIVFIDTKDIIEKMKIWGIPPYRGAYSANIRLFLPLVLDDSVNRVLYLDADTAVNGSLEELYQMNLEDKALAMALDSFGTRHKESIGLLKDESYYNSGVILFDLNNWRKHCCSEKIIEHIQKTQIIYPSPDQDLLNVVCKDNIMQIGPQWNFQPVHMVYTTKQYFRWYKDVSYYKPRQIEAVKADVKIYHFFRFLGEFPWHKDNLHPDNEIFNQYLQISPWNDYEKESSNCGMANKIEKVLYKILPRGIFLGIFCLFHNLYIEGKNEVTIN